MLTATTHVVTQTLGLDYRSLSVIIRETPLSFFTMSYQCHLPLDKGSIMPFYESDEGITETQKQLTDHMFKILFFWNHSQYQICIRDTSSWGEPVGDHMDTCLYVSMHMRVDVCASMDLLHGTDFMQWSLLIRRSLSGRILIWCWSRAGIQEQEMRSRLEATDMSLTPHKDQLKPMPVHFPPTLGKRVICRGQGQKGLTPKAFYSDSH